ncbi:AfsR/SARP family transcriptional regulator [Actinocrispum sp. NPDC049592]|uniref:AfsR/SARP family transcriptional regulator n=1 Tax=Actinocrispum sp. NPDC049592 TaxID=3154835 RepID=UPI00343AEBB9
MRFEILGPLRVHDNGVCTSIGARKMEILLAALLIRAGHVVSCGQLIGEIWGQHPPRRVTAALHVYISQLRKFLDRPGSGRPLVVTQIPGYLFDLGEHELDLDTLHTLVADGRRYARQLLPEQAATAFQAALDLFRGPVLGEPQDGPIISGLSHALDELRLECIEGLMDARLKLRQHRELIGRLNSLVFEYPLHEAFYEQLMVALYRSGRRAEALNVYRTARATLNDELGLEPCHDLRKLQEAILDSADPYAERVLVM